MRREPESALSASGRADIGSVALMRILCSKRWSNARAEIEALTVAS